MKYRVDFQGFAYVEADNPEEAMELAQSDDAVYKECSFEDPVKIDDFTVEV